MSKKKKSMSLDEFNKKSTLKQKKELLKKANTFISGEPRFLLTKETAKPFRG